MLPEKVSCVRIESHKTKGKTGGFAQTPGLRMVAVADSIGPLRPGGERKIAGLRRYVWRLEKLDISK